MSNTSKAVVAANNEPEKVHSAHFENMRYRALIQLSHLLEEERYDDACKLAWAVDKVASI